MEESQPLLLSKNILTDIRELNIEILNKVKQLETKQEDLQRQILILHQEQYEIKKHVRIDPLAEIKFVPPNNTTTPVVNNPAIRRSATMMIPKKTPLNRLVK